MTLIAGVVRQGLDKTTWTEEMSHVAASGVIALAYADLGNAVDGSASYSASQRTDQEMTCSLYDAATGNPTFETACSSLISTLVPSQSWGVTVELRVTEERDNPGVISHTLGPFEGTPSKEQIADTCGRGARTLWYLWQCTVLSRRVLEAELGVPVDAAIHGYLQAWSDRDLTSGMCLPGTTILESDAIWRTRYVEVARRWLRAGDREKAAIFSKAAYDTLQPMIWAHSTDTHTLLRRAPITDELLLPTSDKSGVSRAEQAENIVEAFREVTIYWPVLEAQRSANHHRLSSYADEGCAVWLELLIAWFVAHGFMHTPESWSKLDYHTPNTVMQQYSQQSAASAYLEGLELVAKAGERTSVLLFADPEIHKPRFVDAAEFAGGPTHPPRSGKPQSGTLRSARRAAETASDV